MHNQIVSKIDLLNYGSIVSYQRSHWFIIITITLVSGAFAPHRSVIIIQFRATTFDPDKQNNYHVVMADASELKAGRLRNSRAGG